MSAYLADIFFDDKTGIFFYNEANNFAKRSFYDESISKITVIYFRLDDFSFFMRRADLGAGR